MGEEKQFTVQVDLDQLLIEDLEVFESWGDKSKNIPMSQVLDVLDRVVVGGARKLPMRYLDQVVEAVTAAIDEAFNPKN